MLFRSRLEIFRSNKNAGDRNGIRYAINIELQPDVVNPICYGGLWVGPLLREGAYSLPDRVIHQRRREIPVGHFAAEDVRRALACPATYEEIRGWIADTQLTLKAEEVSDCSG